MIQRVGDQHRTRGRRRRHKARRLNGRSSGSGGSGRVGAASRPATTHDKGCQERDRKHRPPSAFKGDAPGSCCIHLGLPVQQSELDQPSGPACPVGHPLSLVLRIGVSTGDWPMELPTGTWAGGEGCAGPRPGKPARSGWIWRVRHRLVRACSQSGPWFGDAAPGRRGSGGVPALRICRQLEHPRAPGTVCRDITRTALSDERIRLNAAGQVELELKTPGATARRTWG